MALTAKQELFAQLVGMSGRTLTDAYSEAYDVAKMLPKTVSDTASRLAASPAVAARIKVLTERATRDAVAKTGYTLADAIAEADEAAKEGLSLGQVSATVAAVKLKAQLAGHLVEKKEVRTGPLSDADLKSLVAMREEIDARERARQEAEEIVGKAPEAVPQPVRRAIG